jgi:hypothetical protein
MMQGKPIPPAYEGQQFEPDYVELYKKPVYDIVIKPQKRSPYSKMAQNELAKELYGMGFFNPQLAEQTMTALELMDFDGIEAVKEKVQTGQTLLNIVNQLSQEVAMLKEAIGMAQNPAQGVPVAPRASSGESMGRAQKEAQTETMTSYGEKLASRAKPDMNAQ